MPYFEPCVRKFERNLSTPFFQPYMFFLKPLSVFAATLLPLVSLSQITRQAPWQQKVHYTIEVTLDDQNHILRGFETIEYFNNSPEVIEEIYIHLWPNAYKNTQTAFARQQLTNGETEFYFSTEEEKGYIDSLDFFVDGKSTTWQFDPLNIDIARIILNKPLKSGTSCKISTPFLVKIPKVFSRLGHDKNTYNITQWFPKPAVFDVNGWNPMPYLNQGEFYSEFGSFDVKITLPKNYIVAATGHLHTPEEISYRREKANNTGAMENTFVKTPFKTVHFTQDSIHDFAWFASKNFGMVHKTVNIQGKPIEAWVYSQKSKDLSEDHLDAIYTALNYYSDHAGLYPYAHATVVKSELKAGGGMEYPMITVCDILNKEVIIHEVGHNWFYGILGSNERRYPWMDESINSFFEAESMKPAFADTTKAGKRKSFFGNINDNSMELIAIQAMRTNTAQAVGLHSADYTGINYGTMVYGKGSYIFKHLQAFLGEEMLRSCFRAYYSEFQFRHPLPGDMQAVFERVSGRKLDWFFNTLIAQNDPVDFKVQKTARSKSGLYIQKGKKIPSGMPVPLTLYHNKQKFQTVWLTGKDTLIPLPSDSRVTGMVIDSDNRLMDINRKNNLVHTSGLFKRWSDPSVKLFTGLDNKAARTLYLMPLAGFNIHNGFMAGMAFHNWSFPQRKLEFMAAPMWGFSSRSLNGYGVVTWKITPRNLFQSVDLGVKHATFGNALRHDYSNTYTYHRQLGFVHFTLKPARPNNNRSSRILLEFTRVLNRGLEQNGAVNTGLNLVPDDYFFTRTTWMFESKTAINPYSLRVFVEAGKKKNSDTGYVKPGLEFNLFKTYNKKNKGLSVRLFCGTFKSKSTGLNDIFLYRLASKNGQFDYGMEQSLMGRGANTGLWSRNIIQGEDNFKLNSVVGNFVKPFAVLNLSSTLPGKIPIRPYADLCYTSDDHFETEDRKTEHFLYSAGISLPIILKTFEIYFPLVQSGSINNFQSISSGIDSFGERICFTLVLNDFDPHRLFKKIKLF